MGMKWWRTCGLINDKSVFLVKCLQDRILDRLGISDGDDIWSMNCNQQRKRIKITGSDCWCSEICRSERFEIRVEVGSNSSVISGSSRRVSISNRGGVGNELAVVAVHGEVNEVLSGEDSVTIRVSKEKIIYKRRLRNIV